MKRLNRMNQLLIIFIQLLYVVNTERTREKMYIPINGASCIRRLNGTHQTGCSSSTASGAVGVLHLIQRVDDFDFLVKNPPAPPYAPIIPPHLFTRQNILRLKNEARNNVSVILLINKTDKMTQFSHELNCPNQYSGIATNSCDTTRPETTWNPAGTGLLHEDLPFPIYYIADLDEIVKIINCFDKFNNFDYPSHASRSLCSVQVSSFMSAAVSSEVCMRRTNFINNLAITKYCDPLQGKNVYATLFPLQNSVNQVKTTTNNRVTSEEKFILVSCRLDTTSMFDGVGAGAQDSLVSFATLVSVGHLLARLLPKRSKNERLNVLFITFNGESYDYIGSQRLIYDMKHMLFPTKSTGSDPITMDNIELIVDIGVLDDGATINLHSVENFPHVNDFRNKLNKYSDKFELQTKYAPKIGSNLPPTSAQSFLRENLSFPAIILSSKPINAFYHSIYDDSENLGFVYSNTSKDFSILSDKNDAIEDFLFDSVQMKIRNISTAIALALYETITNITYDDNKLANPILADEFLYCFLQSSDCPLFKAASHPNNFFSLPLPPLRYISVYGGPQETSVWTYRILGYLFSQIVTEMNKENCTLRPLHWFAGYDGKGECRLTTQNYSYALSPAFLLDNYNWSSGEYSTWTESTWMQLSARIFLRPSRTHEVLILTIGFTMFILSFCIVYIISSRSEVLFENAPTSSTSFSEPAAC